MGRPQAEDLVLEFNGRIYRENRGRISLADVWRIPPTGWGVVPDPLLDFWRTMYRPGVRAEHLSSIEVDMRADGLIDGRGYPILFAFEWEASRWAWFKAACYARDQVRRVL